MSRLPALVLLSGLLFAGGTTANAMPVSPPPASGIAGSGVDITNVQWGRQCWRDGWGRVHCRPVARPGWRPPPRHCWRDRWGRMVCRW